MTTSSTDLIQYLVISDIHLGKEGRTYEILESLDRYFDNYKPSSRFNSLDIIFLAGDVFDKLLDASSKEIHDIGLWIDRLMRFCALCEIKLRVLKGTPSHDWDQSRLFDTVYQIGNYKLDYRYIESLHIEVISGIGLSVLYIPDEWTEDPQETLDQVHLALREQGLSQVDISIMHGCFGYQLPAAAKSIPRHNEQAYLDLTRGFINIGHVHTHSAYERIIAQGSFDRLAHGEEEPKGATLCTFDPQMQHAYSFIENKSAKVYKTIELKSKDMDRCIAQIEKVLSKVPKFSFIRIKAAKDHPVYSGFEALKLRFLDYNFTKKSIEDEALDAKAIDAIHQTPSTYTPITITRENIVSMIMQGVQARYSLTPAQSDLLNLHLQEIK